MTTFIRSRSFCQVESCVSGAIASRRVIGGACDGLRRRRTASRVSMLADASQSTAIAGFSSGRNSSIHSG